MSKVRADIGKIVEDWDGKIPVALAGEQPSESLGGSYAGTPSTDIGDVRPPPPRAKRGKVTNVGGHRIVNYFELTEDELDDVGDRDRDATRQFAFAAFALGFALDLAKDFLFDPPEPGTMKGLEIALLVVAALASAFYFVQGYQIRKAGNRRLQRIKDAHDFS